MYLSNIKLWNFRKYSTYLNDKPGLEVNFHEGVNVLIGENDSGKTTIIDAIRYVLKTQSGEYIQFDEKDFYQDPYGNRKDEFKIECVFDGLTDQDKGLFWEWLSWNENKTNYLFKVWLYVKRKDNVIMPTFSAGFEGQTDRMDSEARNLLKVVYFKPLRDALTDMTHGYKSRLAQILGALELFKTQKHNIKHKLEIDYENLKQEIEKYFRVGGNGESITNEINNFLKEHFLINGDSRNAEIKLTGGELTEILRLLDLMMEGNKSGLGTLNLLCIAAEMLLFNNQKKGLKLALVEELEAHLHPQYQLRLIEYISSLQANEQFILTTHSITLSSTIKLANMIILKGNNVFPMSSEYTMMRSADYKFLERFLDATKANLFFAKGVIMVEGDAENLLIPAIAKLIGKNLYKYGVSVVNVGNTAYNRYIGIFKRKDHTPFGIPVSVISDLDVRALEYYNDNSKTQEAPKYWLKKKLEPDLKNISLEVDYDAMAHFYSSKSAFEEDLKIHKKDTFRPVVATINKMKNLLTEDNKTTLTESLLSSIRTEKRNDLEKKINEDKIKIFLPKYWTLEYEIARSKLYKLLATAIKAAKKEKSTQLEVNENDLQFFWDEVNKDYPDDSIPTKEVAYKIFEPLNKGDVSKAITAQYLASMLAGELPPVSTGEINIEKLKEILEKDDNLKYLVDAIKHVTQ